MSAVSSAATRVLPARRADASAAAAPGASPRDIAAANEHRARLAAGAWDVGLEMRARNLDAVMGHGDYRLEPHRARAAHTREGSAVPRRES